MLSEQLKERPSVVKVLLHPFAGKKYSRTIYSSKVQPLFDVAGIVQDIVGMLNLHHLN